MGFNPPIIFGNRLLSINKNRLGSGFLILLLFFIFSQPAHGLITISVLSFKDDALNATKGNVELISVADNHHFGINNYIEITLDTSETVLAVYFQVDKSIQFNSGPGGVAEYNIPCVLTSGSTYACSWNVLSGVDIGDTWYTRALVKQSGGAEFSSANFTGIRLDITSPAAVSDFKCGGRAIGAGFVFGINNNLTASCQGDSVPTGSGIWVMLFQLKPSGDLNWWGNPNVKTAKDTNVLDASYVADLNGISGGGNWDVRAVAVDKAGNTSEKLYTNCIIDGTLPVFGNPPVTHLDSEPGARIYKKGDTINFKVYLGETGLSVYGDFFSMDSKAPHPPTYVFGQSHCATPNGDGTYTFSYPITLSASGNNAADGNNKFITIYARDQGYNVNTQDYPTGSESDPFLTLDNVKPVLTGIEPKDLHTVYKDGSTIEVWVATDSSNLTYYWLEADFSDVDSGFSSNDVVIKRGSSQEIGINKFQVKYKIKEYNSVADGNYDVTFRLFDGANYDDGTQNNVLPVYLDNTPPSHTASVIKNSNNYFKNGDKIVLHSCWNEVNPYTVTADFSNVDSKFNVNNLVINKNQSTWEIEYIIHSENGKSNAQNINVRIFATDQAKNRNSGNVITVSLDNAVPIHTSTTFDNADPYFKNGEELVVKTQWDAISWDIVPSGITADFSGFDNGWAPGLVDYGVPVTSEGKKTWTIKYTISDAKPDANDIPVKLTAHDLAGNIKEHNSLLGHIDNNPPTISSAQVEEPDNIYHNGQTINILVQASDTVSPFIIYADFTPIELPPSAPLTHRVDATPLGSGKFSLSHTVNDGISGSVQVFALDSAENLSSAFLVPIVIDNVAPVLSGCRIFATDDNVNEVDPYFSNGQKVTLRLKLNKDLPASCGSVSADFSNFYQAISGGSQAHWVGATRVDGQPDNGTYEISFSIPEENFQADSTDTQEVKIRIWDGAHFENKKWGWTGCDVVGGGLWLDNTAPGLDSLSATSLLAKNGDILDISLILNPAEKPVTISKVTGNLSAIGGGASANFLHIDANPGKYTAEVTVNTLSSIDETREITVTAVDRAGNVGGPWSLGIRIDNVKPALLVNGGDNPWIHDDTPYYKTGDTIHIRIALDNDFGGPYSVVGDFLSVEGSAVFKNGTIKESGIDGDTWEIIHTVATMDITKECIIGIAITDGAGNVHSVNCPKIWIDNKNPALIYGKIVSTNGNTSKTDPYLKDGQTVKLRFGLNKDLPAEYGSISADFSKIYEGGFPKMLEMDPVAGLPGTYEISFKIETDNTKADSTSTQEVKVQIWDGTHFVMQKWGYSGCDVNGGGLWLDNTVPEISVFTTNKGLYKNNESVEITLKLANDETNITISAVTGDFLKIGGSQNLPFTETPTAGTYTAEVLTNVANDGTYEIKAWALDKADNFSVVAKKQLYIDKTLPIYHEMTTTDPDRIYKNGDTIEIIFVMDGSGYVITVDYSKIDSKFVDPADLVTAEELSGEDFRYRAKYKIDMTNTFGSPEIMLKARILAMDPAGNFGRGTYEITLDNEIPVCESTITQDPDMIYRDGERIKLTSRWDQANYTISADFSAIDDGFTMDDLTIVKSGQDYYLTYDITEGNNKIDGTKEIKIWATDKAGNTGTTEIDLVLDNTAPVFVLGPGAGGYVFHDGQNMELWAFMDKDGNGDYTVTADLTKIDSNGTIKTLPKTQTALGGDTYEVSYMITANNTRDDGTYEISFTAQDVAGNIKSTIIEVLLDNQAPVFISCITEDGRIRFKNGDTIRLISEWDAPDYTASANFSNMDSEYSLGDETVVSDGPIYKFEYAIDNDNTRNDGTKEISVTVVDLSNRTVTKNPAIKLYLDNSSPEVSFVNYYKPNKMIAYPIGMKEGTVEVNQGQVTVEVIFSESMDTDSGNRPAMRILPKGASNPSINLSFVRWGTTNIANDTCLGTFTLPGSMTEGTLELEITNARDIALNKMALFRNAPFTLDITQPKISNIDPDKGLKISDRFGNIIKSSHYPDSDWYLKYESGDPVHSNISEITVEIKIEEKNSLGDLKLNWKVASSGQQGQVDLVDDNKRPVHILRAANLNLLSSGVSNISTTDIIKFWISGTDRAGNEFTGGNSEGDPASTVNLERIKPVSFLYGEVNPRFVLPNNSNQQFTVNLAAVLRYYDRGLNKIVTSLGDSSLIGKTASVNLDGAAFPSVDSEFNDNKVTLYLTNPINPGASSGGTREIEIVFTINKTLTTEDMAGKTFTTLAGHQSYSSQDLVAAAKDTDGNANNNNSFKVITQDIFKTMNAAIVPNAVPMDKEVNYTVEVQATYNANDTGVNRIYITVPQPHYFASANNLKVYDEFGAEIGDATSGTTPYASGGILTVVIDATSVKKSVFRIPFRAKSPPTSDHPNGKLFQATADYVISGSSYERSSVKPIAERTTGGASMRVISQQMISKAFLDFQPLAAKNGPTEQNFVATISPSFVSGTTFGGFDTVKILCGPLSVTNISGITVGGQTISSTTITPLPASNTVEVRLGTRISQNHQIVIMPIKAKALNVDTGEIRAKVLDYLTGEGAMCEDTYEFRIGDPLASATGDIRAIVDGNTMEATLSHIPRDKELGWIFRAVPTINSGNTGVDKVTIGMPSALTNISINQVKVGETVFEQGGAEDGWTSSIDGNNRTIALTELIRESKKTIEVVFAGKTPSSLNTSLAFTGKLDNKHPMASKAESVSLDGTPKYTRKVATTAKVRLQPIGPMVVQAGERHFYNTSTEITFNSPDDYKINRVRVDIPGHTNVAIGKISYISGGTTSFSTTEIASNDVSLSGDISASGVLSVSFSANAPIIPDYATGKNIALSLDHLHMGIPITATETATDSAKIKTTMVAEEISANISPESVEAGITNEVTFNVLATIDAQKHIGIDTLEIELPAGFIVNDALIHTSQSPVIRTNLSNFFIINSGIPNPNQALLTRTGSNKVWIGFGKTISPTQTITIKIKLIAASSEGNNIFNFKAHNNGIIGGIPVETTQSLSTRRLPATLVKSELQILPVPLLGAHTVLPGKAENFYYSIGFKTTSATSGVDRIIIEVPSNYSNVQINSGSTEILYWDSASAPSIGNPPNLSGSVNFIRTVGTTENSLILNLASPLSTANRYYVAEIAFTAITPTRSEISDFLAWVDNTSFPNPVLAGVGDIYPVGDGATREVRVQSIIQGSTGDINPRNVLANTGISFNHTTNLTMQSGDMGIDSITIKVPSTYTFLDNPKKNAVKYVYFGGTTEINAFNITVDAENKIKVKLISGTLSSDIPKDNRRIVVVYELKTPSNTDAHTGGKHFETVLGWKDQASFPVEQTNSSLTVRTSDTAVLSAGTETRLSMTDNAWTIVYKVVFSVEMNNSESPAASFAPTDMPQFSYNAEEISFFGNTWQGMGKLPNAPDIMKFFEGSVELTLTGLKDIYGNTIGAITTEVNLAPGFAIRAFENPLVPGLIGLVVRSSEALLDDSSPEVSIVQGISPVPVTDMVKIGENTYLGTSRITSSSYYSSTVTIKASGTDKGGLVGSTDYNFTVQKVAAPKQSVIKSDDGYFSLTIPAKTLEKDQIMAIMPYTLDSETESIRKNAPPGIMAYAPQAPASKELISMGLSYGIMPVAASLKKPATLQINVEPEKLAASKLRPDQVGIFIWEGEKWNFAGAIQGKNRVSANISAFGQYGIFGDSTPPVIGAASIEEDQIVFADEIDITFDIFDNGSGVDPKNSQLLLDGKPVEIVYEEENSQIRWKPLAPIKSGNHELTLKGVDKLGNLAAPYSIKFSAAAGLGISSIAAYPNPASDRVTFRYFLTGSTDRVRIYIYDSSGERIITLDGNTGLGFNEAEWDLINERGRDVANGAYMWKIHAWSGRDRVEKRGNIAVLR